MNTVPMDPRHLPALGVPQHLGMVRTPVGMVPPGMGRHQMVAGHQGVLRMGHPGLAQLTQSMVPGMPAGHQGLPQVGHQGHQQGPFVEDQMEHLAGKLDMLENELRYAWRALDVLSQEYIKMWERLEKMEGLLTEQQTVITQLIDLYTADSSDNADEFENNGGLARFQGLGFSGTGKLGPNPDESFYKSLNAVHKDSYPNTQDNFNTANKGSAIEKSPRNAKKQMKDSGPNSIEYIPKGNDNGDVEMDNKSMSSSMRSTHSGFSDVGEFPVPADTSPTYENLKGGATLLSPCPTQVNQPKRKLPQLPGGQVDNRRTRKDGYIGETGGGSLPTELNFPVSTAGATISQNPVLDAARRDQSGSPSTRPPVNGKEAVRKTSSLQPKLATNIFKNEPQAEVQYDTYPRRKGKKKEKPKSEPGEVPVIGSPLTVIDGNYSFSLTDNGTGKEEGQLPGPQRESKKGETHETSGSGQRAEKKDQLPRQPEQQQQMRPRGPSVGEAGRNITMGVGLPMVQETSADLETGSPSEPGNGRANSLFQQIQAHSDPSMAGKPRKISLKEKRKLRAEQREHVADPFLPKTFEEPHPPQQQLPEKTHSSESDVSMRSDHSVSPKRETEDGEANGQMMLDQQVGGRPRSNGINLLPVQQQLLSQSKPGSREFAVSRALGKYRQKQKKDREHGSSNSDSQDELELSFESRHDPAALEHNLKTLDAKLAEIEEIQEPSKSDGQSVNSGQQGPAFDETTTAPAETAKSPKPGMGSRKVSATESIDTEDEWYKHEMTRLQRQEQEQKEEQEEKARQATIPVQAQKAKPSIPLVGNKMMSSVFGGLQTKLANNPVSQELGRMVEEVDRKVQENVKADPPDKPPNEPPDKRSSKRISRKQSRKQLLRSSASSVPTEEESSETGSADDDSDTQSGADSIDDEEGLPALGDTDALKGAQGRPGNLIIIPPKQTLNISNLPTKPDLLMEVTAAAAEAAYPDHLKNGAFGEDGIWYDDKGETGYYGEDGEWYDYMDEIGYYDNSGEWVEYDYTTGYWDDNGDWQKKSADQIAAAKAELDKKIAAAQMAAEKEADHFLWVSEEGINEFSNDQIPSSELPPVMVIGKLASGSLEDPSPPPKVEKEQKQPNGIKKNNPELVEETPKPIPKQPNGVMRHDPAVREIPKPVQVERKDSVGHPAVNVNVECGVNGVETLEAEFEDETLDDNGKGGGGGRWGALVKQRKADIIELVRT